MAWTTPKTDFAPSDVVTAAQMNAIGENLVQVHAVTGIIPAAGTTPTAGTGFTYTHAATGVYVFTFSPAFAVAPVVQVTLTDAATQQSGGGGALCGLSAAPTSSGFTVEIQRDNDTAFDCAFNFTATPVT